MTTNANEIPGIRSLSADGLPDDLIRQMPLFRQKRGAAAWWTWTEAIAWVRTRSINEIAAQAAWREYLIREGQGDGGSIWVSLIGVSDEVRSAETSLVAALLAEQIVSEGCDQSGERKIIPSTAWHDLHIHYGRTVHLCPPNTCSAKYDDLWFKRSDLEREFPPLSRTDGGDGGKKNIAPDDPTAANFIVREKSVADRIALHLRTKGGSVSAALRELVPDGTHGRDTEATYAAIRKALNHYYDRGNRWLPKN